MSDIKIQISTDWVEVTSLVDGTTYSLKSQNNSPFYVISSDQDIDNLNDEDKRTVNGEADYIANATNKLYIRSDVSMGDVVFISDQFFRKAPTNSGGGSSGTVTKTSIGLGNVDNTSDLNKPVSTDTQNAINAIDKTSIGLGNVENTADLDKPVSIATQNAIANISTSNEYEDDVFTSDRPASGNSFTIDCDLKDFYNISDTNGIYVFKYIVFNYPTKVRQGFIIVKHSSNVSSWGTNEMNAFGQVGNDLTVGVSLVTNDINTLLVRFNISNAWNNQAGWVFQVKKLKNDI